MDLKHVKFFNGFNWNKNLLYFLKSVWAEEVCLPYIAWTIIFRGAFSTIFASYSHDQIDHCKTAEILTILSLRDQIRNGI